MTQVPINLFIIRHFPVVRQKSRLAAQGRAPLIGVTDWPAQLPHICHKPHLSHWLCEHQINPNQIQWYSSPKRRCCQTVDFLQQCFLLKTSVSLIDAWQEQSFGRWEGLDWQKIQQTDQENHDFFWQNPYDHQPPEGESLAQLSQRTMRAFDILLQQILQTKTYAYPHFIIAHAGVLRCLVQYALDLSASACLRLEFSPGFYSHLKVYAEGSLFHPTVMTLNSAFPFFTYRDQHSISHHIC